MLKKEKAVALLRGYLKKRVTEIQKKLSEKETWLGVLNKVQGLLRDVGEKEESQGSEKGDVQECVEHTLRKDQKITKNTKNICLKDKKEKKQINNAGFW